MKKNENKHYIKMNNNETKYQNSNRLEEQIKNKKKEGGLR